MNHETDEDPGSDLDQTLGEAGRRLRHAADPLDAGALAMAVLRRRSRRRGVLSVALALVLVIGGVAVAVDRGPRSAQLATGRDTVDAKHVDAFLAGLPAKPVDPTTVHLVAAVQSFPGCDALIGNLRAVGARHVGSQGFGGFGDERFVPVREAFASASDSVDQEKSQNAGAASGETLGTNVQVSGVDELDHVKAVGKLIYDLDGNGNLRITDATNLQVVSTTAVAAPINAAKGQGNVADVATSAQSLLVDDNRVAVFGSQTETSKPVPDDPSASQATTGFLTVTLLDASDPAHPRITDRVKIDGS
ncbi:MAG: beta-propeller domain-containing protein, partial [Actinobacteria bacterium]|nr:beta-propeller domain-containing protein [Actinomycetota bacterium]